MPSFRSHQKPFPAFTEVPEVINHLFLTLGHSDIHRSGLITWREEIQRFVAEYLATIRELLPSQIPIFRSAQIDLTLLFTSIR